MSSLRLIAACAAALATTSYAFQSASTSLTSQAPHHLNHAMQHRRSISIMQQSSSQEVEDDEDYELVEFFVSPEQINFLRKEAKQRDARKTLPKFFLPPDEQTAELALSDGTIDEVSKIFESDELIEVRGVSKESKRKVFDTAQTLAGMLEDVFEKPVVIVDTKGFAVKLYCPFDSDEQGEGQKFKRIQLRTSYKPGKWTRKPKAIRDERGQVVLDETGKSIKEVPEY